MGIQIGDTVGDYQIIGVLGAGGMGKVYKVRNVISDRVEAMKVLLPDLANEPEVADRFLREIKLLASLEHPNIAALRTALRHENQLLMIMEFVEGESLEGRVKAGPLPVPQAVDAIMQTLAALGYAHQRGVIHRDIKPANMMLTPSGTVKLMDFGIAKATADRRLTMTGTTLGSLYYMSPEQVKGSGTLDGRSDLYSVGISLYELVTGKRPFQGDSDYAVMVQHLEKAPVPPIEVDPRLPAALNEIILLAINKDPEKRFQTAEAFRGALSSLAPAPQPQPVAPPKMAAPPAPPQAQPAPPPAQKSNRGLYMALGAVVAIAVLVVAAMQLPKFFKTGATGQSAPPPVTSTVQPVPSPAVEPVVSPAPAAVEAPAPAPAVAKERSAAAPRQQAPRTQPAAASQPATQQQQFTPVAEPPAPPVVQQQPAGPDPAVVAALRQQRQRMIQLGSRGSSARASLQKLEKQQQASGLGLRGDISSAWKRMETYLDEAEADLKSGNPDGAKENLDQAEREMDKLDKFLGR